MEFTEIIRSSTVMPVFKVKQETNNDDNDGSQWSNDYVSLCNIQIKVEEKFIHHTDQEENKLLADAVKEEYVLTYPDVSDVIQPEFDAKQSMCLDSSVKVEAKISTESDHASMRLNFNSSVLNASNGGDVRYFECFCCRQMFRKESQLRTHLKRCFRRFECDICRRRFKCAAYLATHKQTHVRDFSVKTFDGVKVGESSSHNSIACTEPGCNKTFSRKDRFVVHMRIHNGDKRYQCDEIGCCKKFTEWSNLEKHRRIHTGDKRFVCDEPDCNKKFSAKCNLNEHKRIHTQDQLAKDKKSICQYCDKSFRPSSVRKHLQIHTGVKPYVCNQPGCGKRFMRRYRLIEHNRVHSGEKPFDCTHVSRKFSDKWSFKKHVQTHGNA